MIAAALILGALHEILALPIEFRVEPIMEWVQTLDVWFLERVPVDVDLPELHLHDVARDADHALHVTQCRILRIREDDDVTTLRLVVAGQPSVGVGDLRSVHGLIHEKKVPCEQGTLHAAGGDLKRSKKESANDQEQNERHTERAHPTVEPTAECRALPGRGRRSRL